jgi:hypothetical protein
MFYLILENCPSIMTGKSEVVLKVLFLLSSVTEQHIKMKIITYLSLPTMATKHVFCCIA